MNKPTKYFYDFGEFRLDLLARRFYHGEEVVALATRAFDLLVILIRNKGEVIEKVRLLKEVWSDAIVEEHNLTQTVSVLRKILGDKPNDHRYIMTVPGRGYCFIAPVSELIEYEEVPQQAAQMTEPVFIKEAAEPKPTASRIFKKARFFVTQRLASKKYLAASFMLIGIFVGFLPVWIMSKPGLPAANWEPLRSVAVLPFTPLDKESCKTALNAVMTDALIIKLSKLDHLSVFPARDHCAKKDMVAAGRELGVDLIIDGKVQKIADKVRVSIRLLRMSDGVAVWADQFETDYTKDFAAQDHISDQVVQALLRN